MHIRGRNISFNVGGTKKALLSSTQLSVSTEVILASHLSVAKKVILSSDLSTAGEVIFSSTLEV